MTAPTGRVYPVKVTQRDLALHRLAVAALESTNRPDLGGVCAVLKDLRHRIACAERWEETRTKRLFDCEKLIIGEALRIRLSEVIADGRAGEATMLARGLVRIIRDPA